MGIQFVTSYAMGWMVLVVLLAGAISWFFYLQKKHTELRQKQNWVLAILRFLSLLIIGFLMLNPMVKLTHSLKKEPLVIVAVDHSQSIVSVADSVNIRLKIKQQVDKLTRQINDKYRVKMLHFGSHISDTVLYQFTDNETNFEQLFTTFETRFFNENIGALVLFSDGLVNEGMHPDYLSKQVDFPICCVAVGDTVASKNVQIQSIDHNKKAYLGNNFPIAVNIKASRLKNAQITIKISQADKDITQKIINPASDDFFQKVGFSIQAADTGLQLYKVRVVANRGDFNKSVSQQFVVDIQQEKTQILLLHDGYHPDISVFNRALTHNQVYELSIKKIDEPDIKVSKYALVILYQLPNNRNNLSALYDQIQQAQVPVWFVLGETTEIADFNELNTGFTIASDKNMYYNAQGSVNRKFNLFNNIDPTLDLNDYPPLKVPYGKIHTQPENHVLIYQLVGGEISAYPLWFFVQQHNQRMAFTMGEGIWRWRMLEFIKHRSFQTIDDLILNSIQYLTAEQNIDPLQIRIPQTIKSGNPVLVEATVYNQSNMPDNTANVSFVLQNPQGDIFNYLFDKTATAYRLNLGKQKSGIYSFTASTKRDGEKLQKNGKFIVMESNQELQNLVINRLTMNKIAANTGGGVFELNNLQQLITDLENNTTMATVKLNTIKYADLFNKKYLFIVLFLLLSTGWFLRKLWGII